MEWLINRRRMMYNRASTPAYLTFEDPEVWRICCENWGDYEETVITNNGDNTVNIVTTFKSMSDSSIRKSEITSTQTNVDNSGGVYVEGTVKRAIGITKKQCGAVTTIGRVFAGNNDIVKFNEFEYFTNVKMFVSSGGFYNCKNLEELVFPKSITQIYGGYSVSGCESLHKLILNEGLKLINGGRFIMGNYSLKKLTFPSTVTNLLNDSLAVYVNSSYTCTFIMLPIVPPTFAGTISASASIEAVYVPDNSLTAYKEAQYWSAIADKIYPMSEYAES